MVCIGLLGLCGCWQQSANKLITTAAFQGRKLLTYSHGQELSQRKTTWLLIGFKRFKQPIRTQLNDSTLDLTLNSQVSISVAGCTHWRRRHGHLACRALFRDGKGARSRLPAELAQMASGNSRAAQEFVLISA